MPYKENKDGQTHSFGDGCEPAHTPPTKKASATRTCLSLSCPERTGGECTSNSPKIGSSLEVSLTPDGEGGEKKDMHDSIYNRIVLWSNRLKYAKDVDREMELWEDATQEFQRMFTVAISKARAEAFESGKLWERTMWEKGGAIERAFEEGKREATDDFAIVAKQARQSLLSSIREFVEGKISYCDKDDLLTFISTLEKPAPSKHDDQQREFYQATEKNEEKRLSA